MEEEAVFLPVWVMTNEANYVGSVELTDLPDNKKALVLSVEGVEQLIEILLPFVGASEQKDKQDE